MEILTQEQTSRLAQIGKSLDIGQWEVGDITNDRYAWLAREKPENVFKYHINMVIGNLVGLSTGRVEKLARIAAMFPLEIRSAYPSWGFGYWERAFDKGVVDGVQFMEFLEQYVNEWGNPQPDIEKAMFLYTKHIQGKDVSEYAGGYDRDGGAIGGYVEQNPFWLLSTGLERIKKLVNVDTPACKRFGEIVEEFRTLVPQVMADIGLAVDQEYIKQSLDKEQSAR